MTLMRNTFNILL